MEMKSIDYMVQNLKPNKNNKNTKPHIADNMTVLENFNLSKANHKQFCDYAMALTEKGVLNR